MWVINVKIILDPGHGGNDTGWADNATGLKESDINLDISLMLCDMLKKRGHTVRLTRESDTNVTLKDRTKIANEWNANYYIGIHLNSSDNITVNGSDILIYKNGLCAEGLAASILRQLLLQTGLKNRGIHARNSLAVLRLTKMTAVIVEPAFISNPREAVLLTEREFKRRCAQGIADGFTSFIKNS